MPKRATRSSAKQTTAPPPTPVEPTVREVLGRIVEPYESATIHEVLKKVDEQYTKSKSGASSFMAYIVDNITKPNIEDLRAILPKVNDIIKTLYNNSAITRNIYYSKIRKALSDKYGLDSPEYKESQNLMKISRDEKKQLIEDYNIKVKEANRDRQVFYTEDVLESIYKMLAADHWADKALGLLLCCGARPVELLSKNKYTPVTDADKWVHIEGLAKKRGDKVDDTVTRPLVHLTAADFIKRVDEVRDDADFKSKKILDKHGNLTQNITKILNYHLEAYETFKNDNVPILRKVYANLAFNLYADPVKTTLNVFLSDTLGHDRADISTAASYSTVVVLNRAAERTNNDIVSAIAELRGTTTGIIEDVKEIKDDIARDEAAADIDPELFRQPKRANMTEDELREIIKETMIQMRINGIKITNVNVRKYSGYGSAVVNKFYNVLKAELNA